MPRLVFYSYCAVGLLALVVSGSDVAHALPRYTAEYGQNCVLCHVNPTGGGLRSEYASQYLVPEEMASRGWKENENENFSPRISPNITLGVDLRSLLYQRESGQGSAFAMQGDLYVNVEMSSTFSAYVEQGLNGSGEIFGLARAEVLDSYLKAGRFIPDYGWRFADHQMFNRRFLMDGDGSDNPAGLYGQGLEIGISPGSVSASMALLGGSQRNGENYAGKIFFQKSLGNLNYGFGGAILRRQLGNESRRVAGGLWYLALGPFSWLGEIDETKQAGVLGNMVSQELNFKFRKGHDFRLTYNFQDPDRSLENGSRQRYGAGVAVMPRPYFGMTVMANYWDVNRGSAVDGGDYLEGEMMVHFFY